jgi:hypothetical protein
MKYFIIENNVQQGPFSIYELNEKGLSGETLVWCEGMTDWTPAWKVEELRRFLESKTRQVPPPFGQGTNAPAYGVNGVQNTTTSLGYDHNVAYQSQFANGQAQSAGTQPVTDSQSAPGQEKRHTFKWVALILLVIIILAMIISNPDKDDHREAIKEQISMAISKQLPSGDDFISSGFQMMGKLIARNVIDAALDSELAYHNYILFSKSTVKWNGKSHTVSYGFMGHVFTANADDVAKAMQEETGNMFNQNQEENVDNSATDSKNADENSDSEDKKDEKSGSNVDDKVVNSIGNIVKDQVKEQTDSSTSEGISKIIDDIINFIKN